MARHVVIGIALAAAAAGALRFVATDAATPAGTVAATQTARPTPPSALPTLIPAPPSTSAPMPAPSTTAAPEAITVTSPAEHWGPARAGTTVEDRLLDFSDSVPTVTPAEFAARIDWGDGTTDVVRGALGADVLSSGFSPVENGDWRLSATHTYAEGGQYAATVVISGPGGGSATQALRIFVLGG